MHKEKTYKPKLRQCLSALLAILIISPISFIFGCDNSINKNEKAKIIIEETSAAIVGIDDSIMEEYESSMPPVQSEVIPLSSQSYEPHTQIDRGANQHVYKPISQMTISFGYYALSEYYLEYIPNFIDKTLFIEQTYYPNQKIWSKCELKNSTMDIHIWTEYNNAFEEYINISIEVDKKHRPIKFIHRENRHWKGASDHFGYIEVNLKNGHCIVETIISDTNSEIDYNKATDDTIKTYINRYIREEFKLPKYKENNILTYTGDSNKDISEEQMINYIRNFDYAYTREGKNNFDFKNAVNYAYGNDAMDYAFDKYYIDQDKDTGKLERKRPKQPK